MEESKDLSALLERIDRANQKQVAYARIQCIFSILAALCCAAVLVILLGIVPKLAPIAQQASAVMEDFRQVSSQLAQADWEGLISDLEQVSHQMAQTDLGGIAQDVSGLVQSSQVGIEEALSKLNAIDFEKLNQAITDLAAVVDPLAKVFGQF